jgi:RNA polymerase sigma-70 factor (ECF subfamily)
MTQSGSAPHVAVPFQQFFAAEQKRLLVVALAMTSDREAARDAVQESLARAYARWDQLRRMDQPTAWTRRVLINLLIDDHRRRQREGTAVVRLGSRPAVGAGEPDVDTFLQLVRRLPDRQRAVVVLHYFDDMSVEQIAAAMDVAEGTIKSLLFKARQRLSADLGPKENLQ